MLKQRVNPARYDGIDLPEVDEDVGHTLIHYLLTGQYQTLGSDSVPDDWKAATEFKRSVQAYCAAILCGIEGLEDFAKTKMEELSSELSVFDMQRVLEEMSTKLPQNDAWLPGQMHKWIKGKLVLDDTLLTEGLVLDVIGRSALFDRAVVQGVTDMYSLEKAKVRIALNWKDSERVSQDSTTATSKANGAAEGKISLALPVEVKNDRAKATIHAEPQQRSAPPTAPVYSRPQNIAESVKPMDINFQKARTHVSRTTS